jgi:hypothetical protein
MVSPQVMIVWSPEDIETLRPDWTLEQCEEWLDNNRKHIVDRSIEYGWAIIETLLGET